MLTRLAPSLFRGISVLRKIITSAGGGRTAEVIIFLSTDIPRNRLGASLHADKHCICSLDIPLFYHVFKTIQISGGFYFIRQSIPYLSPKDRRLLEPKVN